MSEKVHSMFASIARRYDVANDVLSLGVHRLWRKKAVALAKVQKGERVLDLCTGTGDFAFELAKTVGENGSVVALDFVSEMLELAKEKQVKFGLPNISFVQGDACSLPFTDGEFSAATIGFGIRNVDLVETCLSEIRRVLKPEGRAVILEFGKPRLPIFSAIYRFYSKHLMPTIGGLLTGNKEAYVYLPETSAAFPDRGEFLELMLKAGFEECRFVSLFGGIAYIYLGLTSDIRGQTR